MLLYDIPYEYEKPDPWERDNPDWNTVYNFIDEYMADDIPGLVRDYIDGEGDIWCEAVESGVLDDYGAASWTLPKDPDKVWAIVEPFMNAHWEDDSMMLTLWHWMPNAYMKKLVGLLIRNSDINGIRQKYNERMK